MDDKQAEWIPAFARMSRARRLTLLEGFLGYEEADWASRALAQVLAMLTPETEGSVPSASAWTRFLDLSILEQELARADAPEEARSELAAYLDSIPNYDAARREQGMGQDVSVQTFFQTVAHPFYPILACIGRLEQANPLLWKNQWAGHIVLTAGPSWRWLQQSWLSMLKLDWLGAKARQYGGQLAASDALDLLSHGAMSEEAAILLNWLKQDELLAELSDDLQQHLRRHEPRRA